jgi:hypothetical protein
MRGDPSAGLTPGGAMVLLMFRALETRVPDLLAGGAELPSGSDRHFGPSRQRLVINLPPGIERGEMLIKLFFVPAGIF